MESSGVAKRIDDVDALALAESLIAHFRPELSPQEQYQEALLAVYDVKVIENYRAAKAEQAINDTENHD